MALADMIRVRSARMLSKSIKTPDDKITFVQLQLNPDQHLNGFHVAIDIQGANPVKLFS
jgi:hypothetical protein